MTLFPVESSRRTPSWLLAALITACLPGPLQAADAATGAGAFAQCVAGLKATALERGISPPVVDQVLDRVQRVEAVISSDRNQAEFTQTFGDYYDRRVTETRVTQGRKLLAEHRSLLAQVQRDTGVPAHYLVAFWGLETNFGSYFGKLPVPDSLATLACDPRRGDRFTDELMDALRIVDGGHVAPEKMVGSWAGAMGHVQFMPSVYLRYAQDGDGDGKRDLWGSIPDAMASAGNFLAELGWEPGLRWGREVRLPADFDYGLMGRDAPRPLSAWVDQGIHDAFGGALPRLDLSASLLVPAGHNGPAFLTYANFDIIMRWNRSEFYALSVGRLADEIAGGGPLTRPPPADPMRISRDQVRDLQQNLARLGYDAGKPDGIFGPSTRSALSRFQDSRELIADGHLDSEALEAVAAAMATPGDTAPGA